MVAGAMMVITIVTQVYSGIYTGRSMALLGMGNL